MYCRRTGWFADCRTGTSGQFHKFVDGIEFSTADQLEKGLFIDMMRITQLAAGSGHNGALNALCTPTENQLDWGQESSLYPFIAMRHLLSVLLVTLLVLFAVSSCRKGDPEVIVVSLSSQPGPGRIAFAMGAVGPSSDPIHGQWDLSDEVVVGIPDTLTDLYVRFLDFQWSHLLLDAYLRGRIDSADYHSYRDPTLNVTLPNRAFDQHVHYAVGRESDGDFVIVFDTDNDEDLSDENALLFPWEGRAVEYREYFARLKSRVDWLRMMGSMPQVTVAVQLFDGERVHDASVHISIIPHLKAVRPTGQSDETTELPTYMIGTYQNMVGITEIHGVEYTFWAGVRRLAGYDPRDAEVWFEKGDQREAEVDSTKQLPVNPYLIGQVVDLNGRFYRLDDISVDGSLLRLVSVENEPGVGIRSGMDAPAFSALTIDGEGLKLSDYRGKYVLLDFWSTSCGPCIKDLPKLREVYGEFSREEFEIIGIAEDTPEWLRGFVQDNGVEWSQITQDRNEDGQGAVLEEYRVTGIPAYFLIDPDGKVVDPTLSIHPSDLGDTLRELIPG